jgi:hypothetical protein
MIKHISFGQDDEKPKNGFKLKWVSTDGWRGYNNVVAPKGYQSVHSDWVTGDWDDAGDHASSVVEKKVKEFEKKHKNITVVTSPTSNGFSTGIDVFVNPVKSKSSYKPTFSAEEYKHEPEGQGLSSSSYRMKKTVAKKMKN